MRHNDYKVQYLCFSKLFLIFSLKCRDSDTFFFRSAIIVGGGGGGGGVSINRGLAGRNQTPFFSSSFSSFFRFQKGGGAHVQKGGAFIEKCFKRGGGGHELAVPPPKSATGFYHDSTGGNKQIVPK